MTVNFLTRSVLSCHSFVCGFTGVLMWYFLMVLWMCFVIPLMHWGNCDHFHIVCAGGFPLLFPSDLLFSFFYGPFWGLLVFYVSFFVLSVVFISYDFCMILQASNCKEPPRLSPVSTWVLFILFLFSSGFRRALSFLFFFSAVSFFSILYVPVSCSIFLHFHIVLCP